MPKVNIWTNLLLAVKSKIFTKPKYNLKKQTVVQTKWLA